MNLLENIVTDMSPQEFEIYCLELLEGMKYKLPSFRFEHNKNYLTNDGEYQLGGFIEFEMLGVKYKTIVECKKYKDKIKRSQIQILHDTIRSTGAHKGIFISTSSFQRGAMDYAREHGIPLMQIVDGFILTIQNSNSPQRYINFHVPKYFFSLYDLDLYCPIGSIYGEKNGTILQYLLALEDNIKSS